MKKIKKSLKFIWKMFKYSIHKHHHHQLKPKDSLREPAASLKWCSISICERTFQIFNSQPRTALCSADEVKKF